MVTANRARGDEFVTKRVHKIAWTKSEFQHLVRILETVRPDWPFTHDLRNVLTGFDQYRLAANGQRLVQIATYEADPKELLDTLIEVKTGVGSFAKQVEEKARVVGGSGTDAQHRECEQHSGRHF
jgi:hypothetical protein